MKKIGIIRCMQTEDICPGTKDFKAIKEGTSAFEETGPAELVGFVSCGGCPGDKVVKRAEKLIENGAEIVAFATCMKKGKTCPNFDQIKKETEEHLKGRTSFMEWTHQAKQ